MLSPHQKIFSVLFSFISAAIFAQSSQKIIIDWLPSDILKIEGESILFPNFKNRNIEAFNLIYVLQETTNSQINYTVANIASETASQKEIEYLTSRRIELTNDFQIEVETKFAGTEMYKTVEAPVFCKKNGVVLKLLSFDVIAGAQITKPAITKAFAANSVLANGEWYRIKIDKSGIYQINKSFLTDAGISANINPQHINIYGNGFGMLPEANAKYRPDDLLKCAIEITGEADGDFGVNDVISFYAVGPNMLRYNTASGFSTELNDFSDVAYYYIHIDASDLPKRIAATPALSAPETNIVDTFDDYGYHEVDTKSLLNVGRRFYGEEYDSQLSYTFNFNSQNLVSGSLVRCAYSYAFRGAGSITMGLNANGTTVNVSPQASYKDYFRTGQNLSYISSNNTQELTIALTRSNPSISGYLDRIDLNFKRKLLATTGQMRFSNGAAIGAGNITLFKISNMSEDKIVWEVTSASNVKKVTGDLTNGTFEFKANTDSLLTFVVNDGSFYSPTFDKRIENQNLHGLPFADYLIITAPEFLSQANRMAELHRSIYGYTVHVASTDKIYNEFSCGMPDPTAIKWFAKMFRDRAFASGTPAMAAKYMCLFGDGSFDGKNRAANNNNLIPTYQYSQLTSEVFLGSLVSDDYFGMLDNSEAITASDLLDIGIGRIVATTSQEAEEQVNKIENFIKNGTPNVTDANGNFKTFGNWRMNYDIVCDDVDEDIDTPFVGDCEQLYNIVKAEHPEINVNKAYLDAFKQETGAGVQRYPEVNDWINSKMKNGSLVMNYLGHGSELQMARELVIDIPAIKSWDNINQGLFVSATCEFGRFDDPARISAGEVVLMYPKGSAIAVLTTSRPVFITANGDINNSFAENAFDRDANGYPLTFGEINRRLKNKPGLDEDKRKFNLLGDPGLRMPLPLNKIKIDSVNGFSPLLYSDTLKALGLVKMKGHVDDLSDVLMSAFNGTATVVVYDKIVEKFTLGQDLGSPQGFETQNNVLFRGKVTVTNGKFEVSFVVPKDIDFSYGFGKISVYADNGITDASGVTKAIYIGGVDPDGIVDNQPPIVDGFFNDPLFAEQGLTSENPILRVKLTDDFGINAVGNGIGHNITAVLDGDMANPIVLNDFYETDLDSYKTGVVKFQMKNIPIGKHTLLVKAWDVNNNPGQDLINFEVAEEKELAIAHVLNYPNPFTTSTLFYFEHNQSCNQFKTQIQIFTISGKLVKTINSDVSLNGFRSEGIPWDGLDDFGDVLAKGVYIYNLKAISCEGKTAEKTEKLVLLR
jgi:Peptidase family C25